MKKLVINWIEKDASRYDVGEMVFFTEDEDKGITRIEEFNRDKDIYRIYCGNKVYADIINPSMIGYK